MKIKLLFPALLILFAAQILFAQNNNIVSREAFEKWKIEKANVSENGEQELLYFSATVKKIDAKSALINFGIAGFKKTFEISVTPLRYERMADGKWNITEFPEAGKLQRISSELTTDNFAQFEMKVVISPDANAVKLSLRFEGKTETKTIILKLSEISSSGILTSM